MAGSSRSDDSEESVAAEEGAVLLRKETDGAVTMMLPLALGP